MREPRPYDRPNAGRYRRRSRKLRIWNGIVLTIGYAAIAYEAVRGIVYLLVLAREWMAK